MSVLSIRHEREIAIVTIDNPPVNAISAELRKALMEAVAQLDGDDSVAAVVLCCAGRTFMSGADIREFGNPPVEPHLPDVVERLDRAAKPWIAAIHGTALGGGFEVAMGCRMRVALDTSAVGLPEVNLGILPGASGTVRTPRLTSAEIAVDLITGGKPMPAPMAQAAGLVDLVVSGDLVAQTVAFARKALGGTLPPPVSQRPAARADAAFWDNARKVAARPGHAAPLVALDAVRFATEQSFGEALAHERAAFLTLRSSDEARALRAVFFAEREALRPRALRDIAPRALGRIGVVGGGTMGAGIVAACRSAGYPAILMERDEAALTRGLSNVERVFTGAVARGKLSDEGCAAMMAGVSGTTGYDALADCDLVIEAVFEDIDTKRAVFAELDRHCRADAILATNTSYLDPRAIADGLSNPQRFLGLHFFSPAHVMKLLEIVPTPDTAPEVLATGFALAKALGKIPVRAGICEGFIGNRILKRYRAEAETLLRKGIAIGDIDAAMRGYGFRMGPFEAQDLGGLDIAFMQREGARAAGQDVPETLGDILVRAGRKGQKTGGGWYDYPDGGRKPQASPQVAALLGDRITGRAHMTGAAIADHLVAAMAAEGALILKEGVAEKPSDIDLVKIHGYGFPRWKGGPMFATGQT